MDDALHLNEFFVEGGSQETSHVLLHLTEPSTPEEKAKGYFFAVAELNQIPPDIITRVQALIDDIENAYYETPDEGEKTALEIVVASFNAATDLTAETSGKLSCILGAIRGEEILLTYVGKPLAMLCYRHRERGYQRLDLLENKVTDAPESQLFEHFVQGKISAGDYILVGTPHIADHFNLDRLEKIITTRKADDSAAHLERVLSDLRNGFSFGGLIINREVPAVSDAPKKFRPAESPISSGESLKKLLTTERQTSETLSPSILPRLPEKLKRVAEPPFETNERTSSSPTVNTIPVRAQHLQPRYARAPQTTDKKNVGNLAAQIGAILIKLFKGLGIGAVYILQLLWFIVLAIARFFGALFFVITNLSNRRQTILENWGRGWRSRKEYLKRLPLVTKILAFATLLGIIGLVVGIMIVRHNQTLAAERKLFTDIIADINLKRDAAESALIYRDENKAVDELKSAQALLATLPCTKKENVSSCAELTAKLSNLSLRLSKLSPINPTLLTTWSESPAPILSNLVRLDTKLIATSVSSTRLYIYDTLTHETKTIETGFVAGTITYLAAPKENDYVVVVVNQKDLYLLSPTDWHLKKLDINFPAPVQKITAVVVYNRRLYTLDSGADMIYKHDAIKNGFGPAKAWLTSPASTIGGGVDLTVDGDMYVLTGQGSIQKFSLGQANPWTGPSLTPPLTTATRLYTYNDVENLYLLDGGSKRLIIFKKSGELKAQLVASSWNDPSDFVIDEPSYTAYVIDQNSLYKLDLPR